MINVKAAGSNLYFDHFRIFGVYFLASTSIFSNSSWTSYVLVQDSAHAMSIPASLEHTQHNFNAYVQHFVLQRSISSIAKIYSCNFFSPQLTAMHRHKQTNMYKNNKEVGKHPNTTDQFEQTNQGQTSRCKNQGAVDFVDNV